MSLALMQTPPMPSSPSVVKTDRPTFVEFGVSGDAQAQPLTHLVDGAAQARAVDVDAPVEGRRILADAPLSAEVRNSSAPSRVVVFS